MFAPKKQREQNLGINAGLSTAGGTLLKIFDSFFFISAQADNRGAHFHSPWQTAYDVIVCADDQLGLHIVGSQLQHAFVVMPRSHGISQRGEPGVLNQRRISCELCARYSPGIERVDVFRICAEPLFFQLQRAIYKLFDPLLRFRIRRVMRRVNKAVIGILAGIQRPHAVELAKKNRGQQMVHSKGVVGMPLQNLIELLHGAIVIKIVEMIERGEIQWIVGPIRERVCFVGRLCA